MLSGWSCATGSSSRLRVLAGQDGRHGVGRVLVDRVGVPVPGGRRGERGEVRVATRVDQVIRPEQASARRTRRARRGRPAPGSSAAGSTASSRSVESSPSGARKRKITTNSSGTGESTVRNICTPRAPDAESGERDAEHGGGDERRDRAGHVLADDLQRDVGGERRRARGGGATASPAPRPGRRAPRRRRSTSGGKNATTSAKKTTSPAVEPANDEELRRLAEQVEQRLGERERREHRQVQRVAPELAFHLLGWARYRTRRPSFSSCVRSTSNRAARSRSHSARV